MHIVFVVINVIEINFSQLSLFPLTEQWDWTKPNYIPYIIFLFILPDCKQKTIISDAIKQNKSEV